MTAVDFDRIAVDPQQMNGQPCIRGMRMTVRRVVEAMSLYPDRAEFLKEHPELEEDVKQALEYAAANLMTSSTFEFHETSARSPAWKCSKDSNSSDCKGGG